MEWVFLIAFMGWMPAPLDISIWHSVWSLEKKKNSKEFEYNFLKYNPNFNEKMHPDKFSYISLKKRKTLSKKDKKSKKSKATTQNKTSKITIKSKTD